MNDRLEIASRLMAGWLASWPGENKHPYDLGTEDTEAMQALTLADALIARELATRPAGCPPLNDGWVRDVQPDVGRTVESRGGSVGVVQYMDPKRIACNVPSYLMALADGTLLANSLEFGWRYVDPPGPAAPRRVLLLPEDVSTIIAAWDRTVGENPSFWLTIAGDVVQKVEVAE